MRLIDADARQNIFNDVKASLRGREEMQKDVEHMIRSFLMTAEMIRDAATVDAVPVVRCKDCKYSYDDLGGLTCSHGVCVDCIVLPGFYCSFGERKEANG